MISRILTTLLKSVVCSTIYLHMPISLFPQLPLLSRYNVIYDGHFYISFIKYILLTWAVLILQEIYKLGARNVGVFSLPPIGCMPAQRTLAGGLLRKCADEHNEAAKLVNTKLSPALHSLANSLPRSRVVYIDVYNPLLNLIQNPQKYGEPSSLSFTQTYPNRE